MYPTIPETVTLVRHALGGLRDRSGDLMSNHCIRVADRIQIQEPLFIEVALLHDIVEDTHVDFEYLETLGYRSATLEALRLLTHNKKEMEYQEYIQRICNSGNALAIYTKLADQEDNLDPKRWLSLSRHIQRALSKKYEGVQWKLTQAMNAL